MERMLEQCSPLSSYFLSCECGDFSDPGGRSGAICGCTIAATWCVRICRRSYDGALPACPVTPRPNCRMTIFARGDCIASSALRHQLERRVAVSPWLNEDVQDLAFAVHGTLDVQLSAVETTL